MQLIKVSDIIIRENRQRKQFDPSKQGELQQSIANGQLLHPPVLRQESDGMVLVAGETRIRAIQDMWMLGGSLRYNNTPIPEGYVPYTNAGELTDLQAEEMEWEENEIRENLTWQDRSAAMARLHSIRSRQAQAAGRIHTVADTAMEVHGRSDGAYQDRVRKDIIVAKYLDNPLVAKAKDANEAFKILKRVEEQKKNVRLAATVGKTFSSQTHEAHHVNCLSWLKACEDDQFDVILTDPPYGMGADTFGDGGGGRLANNEHHYKDDYDSWLRLMVEWCPLSYRVAKPQAHAYVFCDLDNYHKLKELMQSAGWYVHRTPLICTKPNSGRVPLPDQGPRRQWEMILYAIKGRKTTTAIYPDVITTMADPGVGHGAQKPVALYTDLLRRSVHPGDTVLDSFAGSGTIFAAAHPFKVKATGLEMSAEYYAMCLERLKALQTPQQEAAGVALARELQSLMA